MLEEFSVDINVNMIFNNDEHNTLVAHSVFALGLVLVLNTKCINDHKMFSLY